MTAPDPLDAIRDFVEEAEVMGYTVFANRLGEIQVVVEESLTRLDRAEAENTRLREALRWALDYIADGADENTTPIHACEFKDNPEKGACDFHEAYWIARAALAQPPTTEGT